MRICKEEGCNVKHNCKGYCKRHYRLYRRTGLIAIDPNHPLAKYGAICSVAGCNKTSYHHGFCSFHWGRKAAGKSFSDAFYKGSKTGCLVEDCREPHMSKGYCQFHYQRTQRNMDLTVKRYGNHSGSTHSRWKGGLSLYPDQGTLMRNKKIVMEQNKLCQCCKVKDSKHIHHIDNSKDNHAIDNLLAVCITCHRFIHSLYRKNNNISISSKYRTIYGKTAIELAELNNVSKSTIYRWVENKHPFKTE